MALKVIDASGEGDFYNVLQAYNYIYKAQQLGTDVVAVNLSLGGYIESNDSSLNETCELLQDVFDQIGEKGAVSIVAAGNEYLEIDENGYCTINSKSYVEIPVGIDSDYIITVGAITENGEIAEFSNYGSGVDIAAPGTNILSTIVNDNSNNVFNPNLLSDNVTKDLYITEYNFDSGLEDLNYSTYYMDESLTFSSEVETTVGTVSISDDNYYGTNGKSLKWTFSCTSEDLKSGLMPAIVLTTDSYNQNSATNIAVYLEGTSENASAQLLYVCTEGKSTETMAAMTEIDDFNYWKDISYSWFQYDMDLNFYGITAIVMDISEPGTYSVYVDDLYVTRSLTEADYDTVLMPYAFYSGTSMATPQVAAAVAIASNLNKNMTAIELKEEVLSSVTESENLNGKVSTGILTISNISSTEESEGKEETEEPDGSGGEEPEEPDESGGKETEEPDGSGGEETEEPSDTQKYITSNKYTVSNSSLYIKDVPVDTTIEEFKEYIITELNYEVQDKDGNLLESADKVATGFKLVTENGDVYLIAVIGDVTGDGAFDISDVSIVASHLVDKYTIEGIYLKAADVINNDLIDISDLAKLASALVGKSTL